MAEYSMLYRAITIMANHKLWFYVGENFRAEGAAAEREQTFGFSIWHMFDLVVVFFYVSY